MSRKLFDFTVWQPLIEKPRDRSSARRVRTHLSSNPGQNTVALKKVVNPAFREWVFRCEITTFPPIGDEKITVLWSATISSILYEALDNSCSPQGKRLF